MQRSVWACGCGNDGRLGQNDESCHASWVRVPLLDDELGPVVSVHAGGYHTIVRCARGVAAFGCNENGQLGLGDRINRLTPCVLPMFRSAQDAQRIAQIECGAYHTLIRMADGGLYVCGRNDDGQLGLGDTDDRLHPTATPAFEEGCHRVVDVSAGSSHSLVLVQVASAGGNGRQQQQRPIITVPMSAGKGDYGELGYDADPWDTAAATERRVKAAVTLKGHNEAFAQQHGATAGQQPAAPSPVSAPLLLAPNDGTGRQPPRRRRRRPFSRLSWSIVQLPELRAAVAAGPPQSDPPDLLATLLAVYAEGETAPECVESVHAMHLRSAVRRRGPGELLTFGCRYDDGIETETTSVPTAVAIDDDDDGAAGDVPVVVSNLWCAADVAFATVRSTNRSSSESMAVLVQGKGPLTGRGDGDDAFYPSFSPARSVPLPGSPNGVIRGTYHIAIKIKSHSTDPAVAEGGESWVVFGDNFHGQLGVGDEENRETPVRLQPPAGRVMDLQLGARHSVLLMEALPSPCEVQETI